ncbi:hypothetical protein PGB90_006258 [Kerria lacca]
MALVKSTISINDDELKENIDYYQNRIVLAKKMKKLLEMRLYLVKSCNNCSFPGMRGNLTKLELGLTEAINSFHKIVMEHQILNLALQKSIQSTLLHVSRKNLFRNHNLNYLENYVVEQMRNMVTYSETLREFKNITDRQYIENLEQKNNLASKFTYALEKLNQNQSSTKLVNLEAKKKMQKKIDNLNKLSTLISLIVGRSKCEPSVKNSLLLLSLKWRTPRSFEYYLRLINDVSH